MDLLMGVDIGSTNTKAVVFDTNGRQVSEGNALTKLSYDTKNPLWTYWDPDDIWSGAKNAIREAVSKLSSADKVIALGCSCFSSDFIPLDKNNQPLYYFKSWHCSRTIPQMNQWIKDYSENELFLNNGRATEKLVSIYTMRWLKENMPKVAKVTKKILLISDYVNFRLTGEMVTDYTQAATTGAFSPINLSWNEKYLAWAGFTKEQMPKAVKSGTLICKLTKQAAEETGLSEDTLVVAGGHDNECGAFGLGMQDEKHAYNVCGTWEMVICAHNKPDFTPKKAELGITVAKYFVENTYANIIFGISASFLEWAKDNFYGEEQQKAKQENKNVWQEILEGTKNVPPLSNGIFALPFATGGAYGKKTNCAAGTILGIDHYLSKGDVMHAIFEGLAFQTRKFTQYAQEVGNNVFESIIAVGGPTKNRQLMQIKSDVCGKEILVPNLSEGTALGAAMLAGMGAGIYKNSKDAIKQSTSNREFSVFEPNLANGELYNEGYNKYLQLCNLLKDI